MAQAQEDVKDNKLFVAKLSNLGGLNLAGKTISTSSLFSAMSRNIEIILNQQQFEELKKFLEKQSIDLELPNKHKFVKKDIMENVDVALEPTVWRIEQLLKNRNLKYDISIKRYTDYEFPDYQKILLIITVNESLAFINKKLKPVIYGLAHDTIPKYLLDKIIIKFEILK